MAPAGGLPKRKPKENQYIFDLGVKGRKTGLTLPDTGIRDENGLEPMDHLFSSPEKPSAKHKQANGRHSNANATISSEEDMDMGESTIPEPTALLTERRTMRMPPPRSKSPIKTFLKSPARRNPSLGALSSPSRGSMTSPKAASVVRKLDFSTDNLEANLLESHAMNGSPQKRAVLTSTVARPAELGPSTKLSHLQPAFSPDSHGEDETIDSVDDVNQDEEDSFQIVDGGDDEDLDEQDEEVQEQPEPEPEAQPLKKGRGRPKTKTVEPEATEHVKKVMGRRKRESDLPAEQDTEEPPFKRYRRSLDQPLTVPEPVAKGRPGTANKATIAAPVPKQKAAAKKQKLVPIAETDSPAIQRGPPLPRNNRGLFILRRETPMEGSGFRQTRSGRNSVKPVAWWKNERIEYSDDWAEDQGGKFRLNRIKEVVRNDEVEVPRRKRSNHKTSKGKKPKLAPRSDSEEEDEIEPWESEPGRIVGDIRMWDPEDQIGAEAMEKAEEIALSSEAIVTRDVQGATFGFAKTLSLPFFGSGIVDLPAGSIKKPKNSRKMQMVFFVHYGRVQVTVNDTSFRIGKGGMWQVPRGNFYSIENDYEKPARIMFAQGCQLLEEAIESQ